MFYIKGEMVLPGNEEIKMENLSSILVQDDFGNHGSAIIVRGNKATFVIAGGPVQRSIKNNAVTINNVRYRLDKELIHKL